MVVRKHVLVRLVSTGCCGKASSSSKVVGSGLLDLVLCVFLRCASRWPMAVASNEGAYFRRVASVSPVNGGRKPLCNAFSRVDMTGENKAAWAKATRSTGVLAGLLIALCY